MNVRAIAEALATSVGTLTVNGETATATVLLPNTITTVALLVYPPEGDFTYSPSEIREGELTFMIRLIRDPTDVPTRTDALYDWHAAIWDRVETNIDLDLAYVDTALSTSTRLQLDGERYAGAVLDVVEIGVTVRIFEHVPGLSL